MSTFQSTYKHRTTGATRKTQTWYIERRVDGRPRRVPGFVDRKSTEALGRSIEALAASGCHPKTAQSLARHGTITLTMDHYTHGVVGDERAALDRLPDLSAPLAEAARATGTAGPEPGAARLALCLARQGGKGRTTAHHGAQNNADMATGEKGTKPAENAALPRENEANEHDEADVSKRQTIGIEYRRLRPAREWRNWQTRKA